LQIVLCIGRKVKQLKILLFFGGHHENVF